MVGQGIKRQWRDRVSGEGSGTVIVDQVQVMVGQGPGMNLQ